MAAPGPRELAAGGGVDGFASAGLREAQLGVASDNPRALRLYERVGMSARFRVDTYQRPVRWPFPCEHPQIRPWSMSNPYGETARSRRRRPARCRRPATEWDRGADRSRSPTTYASTWLRVHLAARRRRKATAVPLLRSGRALTETRCGSVTSRLPRSTRAPMRWGPARSVQGLRRHPPSPMPRTIRTAPSAGVRSTLESANTRPSPTLRDRLYAPLVRAPSTLYRAA
jgi:hypothetical protein